MFGGKNKEAPRRYDGRLLTVDSVVVPEGKQIRYGDAVVIRSQDSKLINRSNAVDVALETFREAVGELPRQPDMVIGLNIAVSVYAGGDITCVSGTPVWFE